MSPDPPETIAKKIKGSILPKYWYWIILAILIIVGMYLTAKWFYDNFVKKGGKKKE